MLTIRRSVDLQTCNTLAVPAVADHFCAVTTPGEIVEALAYAATRDLTPHILGGGSNLLLPEWIDGLVLQNRIEEWSVRDHGDAVELRVGAGNTWHETVLRASDEGLYGLENLAGIPGSVGATPIQNVGAYGVEVADLITRVETIDLQDDSPHSLSPAECDFQYRSSRFKREDPTRHCITHVTFLLSRHFSPRLSYGPLQTWQAGDPADLIEFICHLRRQKLPDPEQLPNAGCFFSNPILAEPEARALQRKYPALPLFSAGTGSMKVSAGWLVEQVLPQLPPSPKGIGMAPTHALVLINPKRAPATAIMDWAESVRQRVVATFGVTLPIEPQGF